MRLELRAENKTERFFLAIIFSLLSVFKMKQVYSAPQYLIQKKKDFYKYEVDFLSNYINNLY